MELAHILESCRTGDELAWEMLVRRYQSRIFGIAYTYVGDSDEARDISQDIFVRVYRHLDACKDADRFLPWLIRIARNACVDHLRRRKARPPARDIPAEDALRLVSADALPDEDYVRRERLRIVEHALQQLSEINREMILLVGASLITLLSSGVSSGMEPLLGMLVGFIYFYQIFDAGRRASLYNRVLETGRAGLTAEGMDLPETNPFVGGVIMIAVGGVALLNTVFGFTLDWLADWWPLAMIGIGAWLIRKGRREKDEAAES